MECEKEKAQRIIIASSEELRSKRLTDSAILFPSLGFRKNTEVLWHSPQQILLLLPSPKGATDIEVEKYILLTSIVQSRTFFTKMKTIQN